MTPSTLDPHGPGAAVAAGLWWAMLALSAAVYAVFAGLLLFALLRRRSPVDSREPPLGGSRFVVVAGVLVPAVILAGLMVMTVGALRALTAPPTTLVVEVIGHLWWWEVRYPDRGLTGANELHVPVGQAVRVRLSATDVIHSFWVPQLVGKTDLVPGHTTATWLRADQPGVYRGPCAEYCGTQHAKMALSVVAEPPERFAAWLDAQAGPAAPPATDAARRGQGVFEQRCAVCHAVRTAEADPGARMGPDLTHLASRRVLAAGALENTRGNLAGWVANPQTIKPGNFMPVVPLSADDLQALLAYLERLG